MLIRQKNRIFFTFLCVTALLFGSALNTYAQEDKLDDIKYFTKVLCSDSLFGRGYVNDGVGKAARFIAATFEENGLLPFFGDSYFQPFSFEVNSFPGDLSVKIGTQQLIPGVNYIVDAHSGSFDGVLDYVLVDSTVIEDEQALQTLVVQIKAGEVQSLVIDLRTISAEKKATYIHQLSSFGQLLPTVILTDDLQTWSVGRSQMKHPVVLMKGTLFDPTATLSIAVKAKFLKNHTSKNVAAYIPGTKKNTKTILITAHYDHLGGMGQTAYFPGANDNASGVAMTLAIAKCLKENPLKYNVVVVAFAGEEAGLVGSTYFVASKVIPMEDIRFVLNLDIMGSGDEGVTVVNGTIFKKEFKRLTKLNEKNNFVKKVKPRGETQNSDHYPFYKKGVPSFFIYAMGYNKHYHVVDDTYDALTFENFLAMKRLFDDFLQKL